MVARDPNLHLERDPAANDEGEEESFDFELLRERARFVLHSARRRPLLAAITFVVVAGLGLTIAATMPRTYNAQVKLLAQADLVVPALSNPNRAVPREDPTKNVADQILRRDNVIALVKAADLVERYYATRSVALKFKDKILGGSLSPEEKLRVMVGTLEKKLTVTVVENNVIIDVDWSDPQMAYDLVTLVQKNFLEARYDDEVAMISDAIAVLQERAKTSAQELDTALADYQQRHDEYQKQLEASASSTSAASRASLLGAAAPRARSRAVAPSGAAAAPVDAAASADLATALEDTRRQIRAMEDERQRELDTLRGQLAQAQLTLTPQHPTVIALQQKIDTLSGPDEQLAQLKAGERALMARIAPVPAPVAPPAPPIARAGAASSDEPVPDAGSTVALVPALPPTRWEDDARTQIVHSKLEGAIRGYQDAVGRIDGANTELEILRTAFKYRYTVVTPAEVPREPKKPTAKIVGVGAVIAGLLLALLFAAGADAWSGRILEEWQVRRRLKLEILGEFFIRLAPPAPSPTTHPLQPASTALAVVAPATPNVWEDARLQKLWLATQRREWRSLAVIGASEGVETLKVGEMLAQIAWAYRGQPSCVFDLRDLGLRLADYQMREVQSQVEAGVRALLALRSTSENPTAIPLARLADAVVVCIDLAKTRFDAVERTMNEIGRDRVIGAIVVRGNEGEKAGT
jgi:uncharacterized protein involved in exopolysaccharide biosynthesis